MLIALLIPLALAITLYAAVLIRAVLANRAVPSGEAVVLGAITNFFDTLGIGSFAPTMAWFKFRNLVADRLIPCTMLVGHTPPAMVQGFIFLILLGVMVDPVLLVGCIVALLMGGLMGAPLVGKVRLWVVQSVVAVALLLAAALYAVNNLDMMPGGGTATGLPPGLMIIAIVANFIFGVLLNFGVGNYAPTLVLLSLMGMDPRLCFPIMAAGAGLCGSGASIRHINLGQLDLRIALGITLGGIPAVFVAAFIVRDMPLEILRWLVMMVVLYAAAVMARAAWLGRKGTPVALTPEAVAS
ncbi:MAG TPA: TSUP family transporter [Sphingomicrobium sp.]|nr:TSUP family transporter [Sphingomicrobium sp.]